MLPPLRLLIPVSNNFRYFPSLSHFPFHSGPRSLHDHHLPPPGGTAGGGITTTANPRQSPTASAASSFDPQTVLDTLSSYANEWTRALEFFHWVERDRGFRHTVATCNRAIDILGKVFEFDLAWGIVRRMPDPPDHTTFRIIFKRYAAAHLVRELLDAFDKSAEFGLRDRTCYHQLIDALCEYRHVIEAEELCLGEDAPFPADTKVYNMVLRGWYKMRWWKRCKEFWEKMDSRGVQKDLRSYSIYMDILSKSGKPWKAVKLYKEIKQKGFVLDVVAYNTVIHAMGFAYGVDYSIKLYREMLDLGCQPNVVTHNTIIKLLCHSGRFREAYEFLGRMRKMECEPDVITYHCFFQYLNRPNEILCLFERMVETGCRPRMETYVMLLNKFGRWGFLRPVFTVWRAMEEHGCSPDAFAYNALIDALVQKGMIDMARKYDKEMLAKGLSAKPRKALGATALETECEDAADDVF